VPSWASLAALLVLAWRLSPAWRKDGGLQRLARLLLAGAGVLATYMQFHTLAGPEAGITLLVLMVALKLLESEGRRDHAVIVLAGYFLLMATLIHHQQLAATAWLLVSAGVLTAALAASQASQPLATRSALALGGGLILQALPLAVLMFLLFPRLPSPMPGLVHAEIARTGLSDSMAPGSVSQLIRSDEVALRVDFARPGQDARGLYWRGPVLPEFDGRAWRRGGNFADLPEAEGVGAPLDYTVTLEASAQPWLPVAGLTREIPIDGAWSTVFLEWLTPRQEHERLRYTVRSWPDYRLETDLPPWQRALALSLPEGYNPDALALARRWADEAASARAVVERALAYFRQQPFHYTLSPPPLGEHAVDEFLFLTRRGFCEHYAGAFTVLMRAAGVPARVVTGYQGGERNPVGGYWIVRQRDAHAWTEVWLEGAGWVRVDPTAAVAPERVERGIDAALPAAERPLLDLPANWLKPLRQTWDYLNNGWNQWVLGYDFKRQQRLLAALSPSLASLKGMLWAMLAGATLILAGLALVLLRDSAPARDPVERLYQRFQARLAGVGLARGAAEGPSDFAARAARDRPDLADPVQAITGLYVGLRYGTGDRAALAALRRALWRFRPGRRRDARR
jgi:transglutaminase-like putative cysteine protease